MGLKISFKHSERWLVKTSSEWSWLCIKKNHVILVFVNWELASIWLIHWFKYNPLHQPKPRLDNKVEFIFLLPPFSVLGRGISGPAAVHWRSRRRHRIGSGRSSPSENTENILLLSVLDFFLISEFNINYQNDALRECVPIVCAFTVCMFTILTSGLHWSTSQGLALQQSDW